MNKNKISVPDILFVVQSYYLGKKPKIICEELKINRATLDGWLKAFGSTANQILQLIEENNKLKVMFTNASLINQCLADALNLDLSDFPKMPETQNEIDFMLKRNNEII